MSQKHRGRINGATVISRLPGPAGGTRLESFVPWTLTRRGHRKQIITPFSTPSFQSDATPPPKSIRAAGGGDSHSAMQKALGLGHYWQRLLDQAHVATMEDIARAEGMDITQVRRLLRLTLLAPDIIVQCLRHDDFGLTSALQMRFPSQLWKTQREQIKE